MSNEALSLPQTGVVPKERAAENMTVREAIVKLVMVEDMDAEFCLSIRNSDPIPITDVSDIGEGQVVVS